MTPRFQDKAYKRPPGPPLCAPVAQARAKLDACGLGWIDDRLLISGAYGYSYNWQGMTEEQTFLVASLCAIELIKKEINFFLIDQSFRVERETGEPRQEVLSYLQKVAALISSDAAKIHQNKGFE